jgi:hypothetical protein
VSLIWHESISGAATKDALFVSPEIKKSEFAKKTCFFLLFFNLNFRLEAHAGLAGNF